ncbi:hypothetical protein [Shigella sonnei]|nr:hypothetical protein [Shigella sonnei]
MSRKTQRYSKELQQPKLTQRLLKNNYRSRKSTPHNHSTKHH